MKYVIALLTVGILIAISVTSVSAEEKRKDPQPYLTLTGTDSHVREPGIFLIRNESEWIKTWQRIDDAVIASGILSEWEVAEMRCAYEDPTFTYRAQLTQAVWGRKPL